jgi:hypothetical protein
MKKYFPLFLSGTLCLVFYFLISYALQEFNKKDPTVDYFVRTIKAFGTNCQGSSEFPEFGEWTQFEYVDSTSRITYKYYKDRNEIIIIISKYDKRKMTDKEQHNIQTKDASPKEKDLLKTAIRRMVKD